MKMSGKSMKAKTVYLILCVVGVALPYWQFLPWLAAHGFNMPLFLREMFANRIGGFFGMDVLASALVLLVFVATEGRRIGVQARWRIVLAVCAVGVSLGLPLFLYLRERQVQQSGFRTAAG
jgi:Terpene cyclase DEP1